MTDAEIRSRLSRRASEAGSQRKLAVEIGVSPVYLGDVIRGLRAPGPTILSWLGLERTSTVKRKRK